MQKAAHAANSLWTALFYMELCSAKRQNKFSLHGDKDKLHAEQYTDDRYHNILLLEFTSENAN